MLTERKFKKLPYGRRVSEFVALSTDTKPIYQRCYPTEAEFTADKTHYYTKSDDTYTQCNSGSAYSDELYEVCPLNGSTIFCMDTKCKYMFDEDGEQWVLIEGTEE